jgi:hypothetical protein
MDLGSIGGEVAPDIVLFPGDLIRVSGGILPWLAPVPTDRGVIIMSPGVDGAIGGIAFRSEGFRLGTVTKSELKNPHSRKSEFIP